MSDPMTLGNMRANGSHVSTTGLDQKVTQMDGGQTAEPRQPDDPAEVPTSDIHSQPPLVNWRRVDAWLEHASKRTGFPALIVAMVGSCVALTSLCVVVASYRLQTKSDRPNLAALGSQIHFDGAGAEVNFQWNNVGKQILRRGVANLFAVNEGRNSPEKLGSAPLDGNVTNIPPGFGAGSRLNVDSQKLRGSSLLVCVTYSDDAGAAYKQAFLFRARAQQPSNSSATLEELTPPEPNNACRAGD
jgi:hypothetical protein